MALLLSLQFAASLLGCCLCAPPKHLDVVILDLENKLNGDFDYDNHTDIYYYEDLGQEQIKASTVPPVSSPALGSPSLGHTEEVVLSSKPTEAPTLPSLYFRIPGLFGPDSGQGMPTCLLCVCIGTSVYCDDSDLDHIPPLPKETAYLYARFNKIERIKATDFSDLNGLQRIDLTGNRISEVDGDALRTLPSLWDLWLPDNQLQVLPDLPHSLRHIDARNNRLRMVGLHQGAFKDMIHLEFLYLSQNQLDHVPSPLPDSLRILHLQNNNIQALNEDTFCNRHDPSYLRQALEDIRLDGNPIILSQFASAYICLPRLPVGRMF